MSTLKSQIIRATLENAGTTTATESLEISQEGVQGAVTGFLLGLAGNVTGATVGSVAAGPVGTVVGKLAAKGAVDSTMKVKREHLKHDIETISQRITDIKNGDIAEAKKAGISIKEEDRKPTDKWTVIKSALLGNVLPFYTAYQGHKAEELEKDLAAKISELKITFARHGHAVESFEEEAAEGAVIVDNNISHDPVLEDDTLADSAIQENILQIDTADKAIAQLESAMLSLESIYELMDTAQKNGGMTADCRGFAQIALEHSLAPLELPVVEIPSMESFGGSSSRATATRISMESVGGHIKKLWEIIKAALTKAFEYIAALIQNLVSKAAIVEKKADAIAAAAKNVDAAPRSIVVPRQVARYLVVGNQNKDPVDTLLRTEKLMEAAANFDRISSDIMKNSAQKMLDVLVGKGDPFEITMAPVPSAFKNKTMEDHSITYSTDLLPGGKVFSIAAPAQLGKLQLGKLEWAKHFAGITSASFRVTVKTDEAALQKVPESLSITALNASALENVAKYAKSIAATTYILKDIAKDDQQVLEQMKRAAVKDMPFDKLTELWGRYCQARMSANGRASSMVSSYALTVVDAMLAIAAESIKSYKTPVPAK